MGDLTGVLNLLFDIESHKFLGVGIMGKGASELVHIGQTVPSFSGTIEYFIDSEFNYPTLAECYKTAAYGGLNRLEKKVSKRPAKAPGWTPDAVVSKHCGGSCGG